MHFEPAIGMGRCLRPSLGIEAQWQWPLPTGLRASARPALSCPRHLPALGMPLADALPIGLGPSIHLRGTGNQCVLRSSAPTNLGPARSARPVQALHRAPGASGSGDALSAAAARPRSASPSARSGSPPHSAKPGPSGGEMDAGVETGRGGDCAYLSEAAPSPRRGRGRPRKASSSGRCEASAVAAPSEVDQAEAEGDMPLGKFQCRKAVPCSLRVKSHKLCSNCISRLIKSQGEQREASSLGLGDSGPLPSFAPDDWAHEEPLWLPRYASLPLSSAALAAADSAPLIQIAGVTVRARRSAPGVPGSAEPEERRPTPKTFQGLLASYVTVREEVQSWSDYFKANNGRRPKVADVEATRMPWLMDKFAEYLSIRATLESEARGSVKKAALYAGARGRFTATPTRSPPALAHDAKAGDPEGEEGAGGGAREGAGEEAGVGAGLAGFRSAGFGGTVGARESARAALERRWDAGVAAGSALRMDQVDDWVFSLAPSLGMGAPGDSQHRRRVQGVGGALGGGMSGRSRGRPKGGLTVRPGDRASGGENLFAEGGVSSPRPGSGRGGGRRRDEGIEGIPLLDAAGTHVMGVPEGPLANQWEMLGFQSAADTERLRSGAKRGSRAGIPLPWMPSTGMGDHGAWRPGGTPKAREEGAAPSACDGEGVSGGSEGQLEEGAPGAEATTPGPEAAAGAVGSQDVPGTPGGVPGALQGEPHQGLREGGEAGVLSQDKTNAAIIDSWPVEESLPPAWLQVPRLVEQDRPMGHQESTEEG